MTDNLRAGYGERIITPPLGVDLCGYGFYLDRKADNVLDDLKVRALYLSDGDRALILIVCDLIGLTVDFSDRIRAEVASAHRIPASHVLLACTHTHSGPAAQPLPGLGEVDAAYMKSVAKRIIEAAGEAVDDSLPSEFRFAFEAIEPIGYNRRDNDFRDIDPRLRAVIFKTERAKIYLLNYACHPVVFGPRKDISADWPGAWIREIEKDGHRAVFFQGFCGDIDPVTQMNRWGQGTPEDLQFYGDFLKRRLDKAEKFAEVQDRTGLAAAEKRIRLPLNIYGKRDIEREAAAFRKKYSQFPGAEKFAGEWRAGALANFRARQKTPFLENVPIQAMAFGPLKILGLPGEVFCRIGLKLQKAFAPLVPIGYANGSIGYIPSRNAYRDGSDYACYCAPMFYQGFPFTPDIERIILGESRQVLTAV